MTETASLSSPSSQSQQLRLTQSGLRASHTGTVDRRSYLTR